METAMVQLRCFDTAVIGSSSTAERWKNGANIPEHKQWGAHFCWYTVALKLKAILNSAYQGKHNTTPENAKELPCNCYDTAITHTAHINTTPI
eukprot:5380399-Ditylum_brightwellii.AAC.1